MNNDLLQVEIGGGIARVVLNRPEVRNAFNENLIAAITESFGELGQRDDIRCIVLTATGTAFCAGADLNWMRSMADYTREQNMADAGRLAAMMRTVYECPKPTIARIQGDVYAGGTGLVAACDKRAGWQQRPAMRWTTTLTAWLMTMPWPDGWRMAWRALRACRLKRRKPTLFLLN